ncbi:SOS response-associated peptidase [Robiginitalea sp. SC105]|uniref:SOS response-associated peptidase n=1 Tax=Robiginitalea sp. SC105 TaxID=2762332 RepID=UPI00163AA2C9|nr:SOS response-associated peptidase family protein [Robiginitalea sp. SC105]MBC2837871.1 SOS response-associated peptidase family protein [Robiginitalea sp. SC105]
MFYRLSNTAKRGKIEKEFGTPFKYPRIYQPRSVIDGLSEESLPVITQESPEYIQNSIWGLLPDKFREDWHLFQNSLNTLNLRHELIEEVGWLRECLANKRCLIIANGYFTMHHYDGELYPYYIYRRDKKPFAIAGIYNMLDDGFLTCSLLVGTASPMLRQIQNLDNGMPVILGPDERSVWLGRADSNGLQHLLSHPGSPELVAHPIARELYNRNICYESMLDPVHYKNLPIPLT